MDISQHINQKITIVLTGFGPFGTFSENPSERIVRQLTAEGNCFKFSFYLLSLLLIINASLFYFSFDSTL